MTANEPNKRAPVRTASISTIIGVLLVLALFGPIAGAYISYGWTPQVSIIAVLWQINSASYGPGFPSLPFNIRFTPEAIFASFPFVFLRYVFVFMVYRLYTGKTTRRRTYLAGLAAELQLVGIYGVMSLVSLLSAPYGGVFYMPIIVPIPVMFLCAYAFIRFISPPEEKLWIEEETPKQWWERFKTPIEEHDEQPTSPEQQENKESKESNWLKE